MDYEKDYPIFGRPKKKP